jgi:cytochrome d ubiquinol oxidase subunit I
MPFELFDPVILSRIQFGFTVAFHILFPSFTIGLASFLALLAGLWLWTNDDRFRTLYQFWVKIFAVSFGMGVVSGIVMSYQFGTNWSRFSDATGNILGPLMSYEVVTAFFLEATFLGVMLFGQNKVPRWLHFFATVMVAFGTLLSTFWIISANSWMQTPAGFELRDGVFYAVDWWAIVFNPSFPYRLVHMVLAAYLTTCFVILGISAWYLLRNRFQPQARLMMAMAVIFAAIVAPLQIIAGDLQGLNVRDHQPAKLAAMEGIWETGGRQPLLLFAIPDEEAETNHYEVGIPGLGSLIITHAIEGEIQGLRDFPEDERPPVAIVFWTFRVMVAIGFLMLFTGVAGLILYLRGRLYTTRWYQRLCMAMIPSGFVAVILGWMTAEVGRQPYVVYGLMRTADATSPVPGGSVFTSLALFIVVYGVVFGAGTYYLIRLLKKGPEEVPVPGESIAAKPKRPLSAAESAAEEEFGRAE